MSRKSKSSCIEFNYVELINFTLEFQEPRGAASKTEERCRHSKPFQKARGKLLGPQLSQASPVMGWILEPIVTGHLVVGVRLISSSGRGLIPGCAAPNTLYFSRVLAPRRSIPTPSPKVPTKASACNSLLNSPPLYVPTADAVINCRPLRSSWPPPIAGPGVTSWRITIKCFARIKSFVV